MPHSISTVPALKNEVSGGFLLGLIQSFQNLIVLPQEGIDLWIDQIKPSEWYPYQILIDVLSSIDKTQPSANIYFHAGVNYLQLSHQQSTDKPLIHSGLDWLYANQDRAGYNTVVRGNDHAKIGECRLVSIDEAAGIAVYENVTPLPADYLRGYFYAGSTLFDDMEYVRISSNFTPYLLNPHFKHITLTVHFRLKLAALSAQLDEKLDALPFGATLDLTPDEISSLIWRYKNLKENIQLDKAYHDEIHQVLAQAVTTAQETAKTLSQAKEHLEAAASAGLVGVWSWDIPSNHVSWDKVMYQLYGFADESSFGGAYESWERALHPDDKLHQEQLIQAVLRGECDYVTEFRVIWPDGSIHYIKAVSRTLFDAHGQPLRMTGVNYDLTEQKALEDQLRIFKAAIEQSPVSIIVTDAKTRIEYANPHTKHISGYRADELIGHKASIFKSGLTTAATHQNLWDNLSQGKAWTGELINRSKSGNTYIEESHIAPICNAQGVITHYLAIKMDITERKLAQAQLEQLAHFDLLTQLPNRQLFFDRVERGLALAKRNGSQLGLMMLDLDKFKPINDTWGHAVGDFVLQEVARRLLACVRESDTVGRIGGDEFVILLMDLKPTANALLIGEKIRQSLNEPIRVEGKTLNISACIGIALYPNHGLSVAELFKNADAAMYQAKTSGRNRVIFF